MCDAVYPRMVYVCSMWGIITNHARPSGQGIGIHMYTLWWIGYLFIIQWILDTGSNVILYTTINLPANDKHRVTVVPVKP